jgi:hypothetical protein
MNRSEERQTLNLSFFVNQLLLPEVTEARWGRPRESRLLEARSQAALFEVFGWLYLGVQVGYFSREQARSLLLKYREDLFPEELLEVSLIRNLFPQFGPVLERVIRGDVLPALERPFGELPALQLTFRTALILGQSFSRDPLARVFTTALDFASEASWRTLVTNGRAIPEQVSLSMNLVAPFPAAVSTDTIYAGFLRTLEYMEASRDLFDERAGPEDTPLEELELRRRVRQLQAWRVNLHDRKERFLEVANRVTDQLSIDLYGREPKQRASFFLREVLELANYWIGEAKGIGNQERGATA